MRFTETDYSSPGQLDFVPRRRRNQIWRIIVAFGLMIAMILFLGTISPEGRDGSALFLSVFIVACLCFYVVYRKQQSLDLVMDTEYQNLLFSQAAALGSSFCIFVRRDGTIFYANEGLRNFFPKSLHGNIQSLEVFFDQVSVTKSDRGRIMSAIYNNAAERLVFPIQTTDGQKDYVMTVDPLARPGGFLVLRGREFVSQRAGLQLMPDVLRTTSADKLDHMLAHSPVAHYTTDPYGKLEYANPAFERLVGYSLAEMGDGKLTIARLIHQLHGRPVPDDYTLADFNGDAIFHSTKDHLVQTTLTQRLIRDASGKVVGASGTALLHGNAH